MNPKVSIIIPNYNHAPYLQERLDTVFNQTFQDFEVILLDDASTDDSRDILKNYAKHPKVSHYIVNEENSGSPFKQWQKGIALAKGEYIWIAESDDYCEVTFLEFTIHCLLQGHDICYTQTFDVNSHGGNLKSRLPYTAQFEPNIWEKDFVMDGNVFNTNYLLVKNVIPNASAVMFKRSIVNTGYFNKSLLKMTMCGDWLFWIRICANNSIAFVSEPLNYFRYHDTMSRRHNTLQKQKLRLEEEALLRSEVFKNLGIRNKQQETLLYKKWFELHGFFEVFTKRFYNIKLSHTLQSILFLMFVSLKLKNRFKF